MSGLTLLTVDGERDRRNRINMKNIVDNVLPSQWRTVIPRKLHSRWVNLKRDDLLGEVGMGNGGCDETDGPALTVSIIIGNRLVREDMGPWVKLTK